MLHQDRHDKLTGNRWCGSTLWDGGNGNKYRQTMLITPPKVSYQHIHYGLMFQGFPNRVISHHKPQAFWKPLAHGVSLVWPLTDWWFQHPWKCEFAQCDDHRIFCLKTAQSNRHETGKQIQLVFSWSIYQHISFLVGEIIKLIIWDTIAN